MTVLYEDNHLIIVNKQAGEIVQGDKTGDTPLSDIVKEWLKEKHSKPGNVYLGVVHRLDRPVSGVVLFAKTSKALPRLNKMFAGHENVSKTYWAIVQNRPQVPQREEKHGTCLRPGGARCEEGGAGLQAHCLGRQVPPSGNTSAHGTPPPDTMPTGQDGLPHKGRPEIRCSTQQSRRKHIPARPQSHTGAPREP